MMKPYSFTFSYLISIHKLLLPLVAESSSGWGREGRGTERRRETREREREETEKRETFLTLAFLASSSFLTYSLT